MLGVGGLGLGLGGLLAGPLGGLLGLGLLLSLGGLLGLGLGYLGFDFLGLCLGLGLAGDLHPSQTQFQSDGLVHVLLDQIAGGPTDDGDLLHLTGCQHGLDADGDRSTGVLVDHLHEAVNGEPRHLAGLRVSAILDAQTSQIRALGGLGQRLHAVMGQTLELHPILGPVGQLLDGIQIEQVEVGPDIVLGLIGGTDVDHHMLVGVVLHADIGGVADGEAAEVLYLSGLVGTLFGDPSGGVAGHGGNSDVGPPEGGNDDIALGLDGDAVGTDGVGGVGSHSISFLPLWGLAVTGSQPYLLGSGLSRSL